MKTISKISCALLGAMLLSSIFSGLVVGITEAVKLPLSTQSIQMIGGCMSSVWYVYFFQLFTKSMKKRNINEVSLGRKNSICDGGRYLLILLGMTTLLSNVTDKIVNCLKIYLINGEMNEGVVESYVENVPIVLLFVCAVIVSPIFEELLFRKILLEKLLPYGKVIAIAISSLFFGLYHANLEQLLYTMFLGVLCANIVIITGKIKYAIYLHMAFNLFGVIISDFIPIGAITTVLQIVFVMSAVLIFVFKGKTMVILKDEDCVESFCAKKEFLSIGFTLYIAFFVIGSIGAMGE